LFFCSQVIESWFLDESLGQILKHLCPYLECFVLEMDDNGAVCFLFWMKDFFDNWKLVWKKENRSDCWNLFSSQCCRIFFHRSFDAFCNWNCSSLIHVSRNQSFRIKSLPPSLSEGFDVIESDAGNNLEFLLGQVSRPFS
jgi:hypothetical protein